MRAMLRGRAASVTSTIESPVERPVRANRRPPAVVYPQLPAALSAAPWPATGWAAAGAWARVGRSRWERSAMLRAPAAGEGEATATVEGAPDESEPQPERASGSSAAATAAARRRRPSGGGEPTTGGRPRIPPGKP